jgi:2,3-bisphosphoglycerate-dependent phosphoglycerate mutase
VTSSPEPAAEPATAAEPRPGAAAYHQTRLRLPPGSAELLLIRHGQSQTAYLDQPFPLAGKHADPELSELGHRQAQLLADRLTDPAHGTRIDAIYVTTLRRTVATAAPLAARTGLRPQVEPELREVFLGDWEGALFRKMTTERHPAAERIWAEERWDVIPGAEPASEFAARVGDAIRRLAAAHTGQRIAVVVHGGVIGEVLAQAAASRPFAFLGADNASISRLAVTPTRWIVRGYNDTAHLDALLPEELVSRGGGQDSSGHNRSGA